MGNRRSNEDQQRDDDRSRPDDYKAVLLDLPLGSLFCSCCEPRQWRGCVRREWLVVSSLLFRSPLHYLTDPVCGLSVSLDPFAPPETAAPNPIHTSALRAPPSP